MANTFTHLHVHSHYSLLDGLPTIPLLVDHAKGLGFETLALTDHGALYGAVEFYQACLQQNIKPIIGVETYVAPRRLTDKQAKLDERPYHLILLAETITGYNNLITLISRSYIDGFYYKPRVDLQLLQKHHEGIIALSACLNGAVARTILQHGAKAAREVITSYQSIFGMNNFFLEMQIHPTLDNQGTVNTALVQLSQETGAGLVATADSHYLNVSDAEAQDILVAIQTKRQISETNRLSMQGENYALVAETEMIERFSAYPEAIRNTQLIADRCQVTLPLGTLHLPHYALPEGQTAEAMLRDLCLAGIAERYGNTPDSEVERRLNYELDIIVKTGYASYFIIVQDFVNWAKSQKIVVGPGRGSAAGSIVSYLTGITNIDPIKYDLLFERFLNPERVSMPDIDLDFADTRRDEVIRYVEHRYGKDHVAQIITFGTMAARAAVRDVGRALGIAYGYCDMIAKLIPPFTTLAEALITVPELQDLYRSDPDAVRLLDSAKKLEGVARHTSTHACGVVITKEPLEHYAPIQYSSTDDNSIVTQYSLHSIEALGLLKMDFLGLKNLTIIEQAIEIIRKTTDREIDINTIPRDDKATYRLLQRGLTTGIFQLESVGMKRCLRELKPTTFEDIIAMVALYRPGPMERIPEYIDSKHGRREIHYLHPALKPILEKTYGVLVYQEQVMALVRDLAGFTAGEGYLLIKAVAKKISSLLNEQKNKFIQGSVHKGLQPREAEQLWEFIEPFARYGFNKSHSTGYALIAYQTAYLKAHYPAQFMASLLTSDQSDSDRIAIEVLEARELGMDVLSPDINESYSTFTVVRDSKPPRIRFGLAAIKNIGQAVIDDIIKERTAHGPYTSIEDFLQRLQHKDLNRKSLESLIKSSALEQLGEPAQLLANIDILLQYNRQIQQAEQSGQASLFEQLASHQLPRLHLSAAPKISQQQRLLWERELLGLYISGHPLTDFYAQAPAGITTLAQALTLRHNTSIHSVVLVNTVKKIYTKKGEEMLFIQVDDPSGKSEVIVFPSAMANIKTLIHEHDYIGLLAKVSKRNGDTKLIADEIRPFTLVQ